MQRTFRGLILSAAAACLVMPAIAAPGAQAAEKPQEWELVNPAGIIEKASVDPAKRIASLGRARRSPCAGTASTTVTWC